MKAGFQTIHNEMIQEMEHPHLGTVRVPGDLSIFVVVVKSLKNQLLKIPTKLRFSLIQLGFTGLVVMQDTTLNIDI